MSGPAEMIGDVFDAQDEFKRAIDHIVATTSPAHLFEIYYWLQEPDLLRFVRQLAALSVEDRKAIEMFLSLAEGHRLIAKVHTGEDPILALGRNDTDSKRETH